MKIPKVVGYMGDLFSGHAGYRYRIESTCNHIDIPYIMGSRGDITIVFRTLSFQLIQYLEKNPTNIIYDITNFHLLRSDDLGKAQQRLCNIAKKIVCPTNNLAKQISKFYESKVEVVEDCYLNDEWLPTIKNDKILWFGHPSNHRSLYPYLSLPNLTVCSKNITFSNLVEYSEPTELNLLRKCGLVLLTSNNPTATNNRILKALRAGKFVITPNNDVESWNELQEFIWQGDVQEGISWALANKQEAMYKVRQGQIYIREKYHPKTIGKKWRELIIKSFNE